MLFLESLGVLRLDDVEVSVGISPRGTKVIRTTDFADISITVTNNLGMSLPVIRTSSTSLTPTTARPIQPYVRLEPLPSSSADTSWASTNISPSRRPASVGSSAVPARNVAFDGTLTRVLSPLQPGETGRHDLGVIFLASGDYAFRAALEEVDLSITKEETVPKVRFSPVLHVKVIS